MHVPHACHPMHDSNPKNQQLRAQFGSSDNRKSVNDRSDMYAASENNETCHAAITHNRQIDRQRDVGGINVELWYTEKF